MTAPRVEALKEKPHGPVRTWAKRLLGPFYVTGTFWYRGHYWITGRPQWVLATAVFLSTWFFWATLWKIRAAVAANLEPVLGPCGWWARQRRIWRTFYEFAWCQSERYEQFRPDKKFEFDFRGDRTYELMRQTKRGFVFFTAHFGNWEMGPCVDELPGGRKFHVVREPEMSQSAQEFVQELFDKHPQRDQFVVHYAGADMALGARLLMALRKGDVIGMPGDRPRAGMETMPATMFGRSIDLPPGPVALARAADALMVPVFVFREGRRRYRVELWEPIEVGKTDDKQADLRAGVASMAGACERAIRERPHHWFCWAKLWR
ncbi:MAG: lysophospholipid acyltransferase family protein [Planctomycetota bacterium]